MQLYHSRSWQTFPVVSYLPAVSGLFYNYNWDRKRYECFSHVPVYHEEMVVKCETVIKMRLVRYMIETIERLMMNLHLREPSIDRFHIQWQLSALLSIPYILSVHLPRISPF